MIKFIICGYLMFFTSEKLLAQAGLPERGFSANASIGGSISQLTQFGDRGFRLLGLRAGGQVNYTFADGHQLSLGLMYQQTGDAPEFKLFDGRYPLQSLAFHSLSLPLLLRYQLVQNKDINAVSIGMGPVLQRAFSFNYNAAVSGLVSDPVYNNSSVGIRGELQYRFSHHSSFSLGYEHILSPVVISLPASHITDGMNISWSVVYDYHF